MKVIVVGGGAAGIAAAYTLLAGGAQVSLYDARGRYGGRAYTDTTSIPNFAFDMGPQYLQDPNVNPWSKIAEKLKIQTVKEEYRSFLRIRDPLGNWSDTEDTDETRTEKANIEAGFNANKSFLNKPTLYRPATTSEAELLAYATTPYGPIAEAGELWEYIAADRARQKEEKEVSNHFVKGGVGTLIKTYGEGLEKQFPKSYTKLLSTPVIQIRYRSNGVVVTAANKKQETADACLVTVAPSVLAEGAIAFDRALPREHREAMECLKNGSYKKVALALATIPDALPVNTQYFCMQRNPHGVWQYYRLSLYPEVLVAHAAGDFAKALDLKDDDDVVAMLKATMTSSYPTIRFGGASALTNWTMDRYARGAYSYTAVKTRFDSWIGREFDTVANFNGLSDKDKSKIQTDKTAYGARLRFGVPLQRTLWFAGEATDVDAYGTIAGAYNEGVRAATEILNRSSVGQK